ncbi:MAG: DUF5081 family protein [Candidatus Marsarchaeota archaeon]|nr:DUF5081 family protein [Candidatus Marsarchaeota archaeon]
MEKIEKDEAKAIFRDIPNTKSFVLSAIDHSQRVYTGTINYDTFVNVLGFPWKDWKLFSHLKEEELLTNANKLSSMRLKEIASNYNRILPHICTDGQTYRIEDLKSKISSKGYIDNGDHLLIFERDTPDRFYINDGMHRFIAYESLIQSEKAIYIQPLKCVYAEVIDIHDALRNERFNVVGSIFSI